MNLTIKNLKGAQFQVAVETSDTVLIVKDKISQTKEDHPAARLKLIHAGKVLKDESVIGELGISENDFIVCMVTKETAKPKAPPPPAVQPPVTTSSNLNTPATTNPVQPPAPVQQPPPANTTTTPNVTSTPISTTTNATTPTVDASVNTEALNSLLAMGFPESECKAALTAAQGNPDLAVEFLMGGIPPALLQQRPQTANPSNIPQTTSSSSSSTTPPTTGSTNPLDAFRSHPQFNQLKQLVQQNPAAISQVMDAIGRQNPALLEAIHANHDGFVAMMNEPITETPPQPPQPHTNTGGLDMGMGGNPGGGNPNPAQIMQMLSVLPPEQRNQLAQSMGMSPEQLQGIMQMMSAMPPEQLQQLTAAMGQGGMGQGGMGQGGNVIRLTEEEMQSVNRLMELGFSQQEAAQAFLACDRNEALAANLLLEGGWSEGGMDDGMGGFDDEYQG
eukprot:TRINITY_DN66582_c12_g2_i1.p1 TRINITY_DN66582_c12_g2~~TRINITY_DN66582_c12_g2_i1.p1  ORF type:complete len:446 (+),score=74.43 TRINITY_DN66582_c12_g2_i1:96-1433(+)